MLDRAAVRVAVDGRSGPKTLLEELSLELTEPRIGVIGANGSGKSTLLRLLNGLVAPSSGAVTVDGWDTVRSVRDVRRRVGFVFTDPLSQLVMPTGREDVELSLRRSVRNARERRAKAERALDRFGLLASADQSIYELSGGERQLLALTAVLAVDPDVLVLDEPSTLLDLRNRELLRRTLAGLSQQVILSTHDLELVRDLDRVLVVDAGAVVFDGLPAAAVDYYRELCAAGLSGSDTRSGSGRGSNPGSGPGSGRPPRDGMKPDDPKPTYPGSTDSGSTGPVAKDPYPADPASTESRLGRR